MSKYQTLIESSANPRFWNMHRSPGRWANILAIWGGLGTWDWTPPAQVAYEAGPEFWRTKPTYNEVPSFFYLTDHERLVGLRQLHKSFRDDGRYGEASVEARYLWALLRRLDPTYSGEPDTRSVQDVRAARELDAQREADASGEVAFGAENINPRTGLQYDPSRWDRAADDYHGRTSRMD